MCMQAGCRNLRRSETSWARNNLRRPMKPTQVYQAPLKCGGVNARWTKPNLARVSGHIARWTKLQRWQVGTSPSREVVGDPI